MDKRFEKIKHVSEVTYTCGHSVDFEESAPDVKDLITCRICLKLVKVTKVVDDVPRVCRKTLNIWQEEG